MGKALAMAQEDANTSERSHTIWRRKKMSLLTWQSRFEDSNTKECLKKTSLFNKITFFSVAKNASCLFQKEEGKRVSAISKIKLWGRYWPQCCGCSLQGSRNGSDETQNEQRKDCCACWLVKGEQPPQPGSGKGGSYPWGLGSKNWELPARSEEKILKTLLKGG